MTIFFQHMMRDICFASFETALIKQNLHRVESNTMILKNLCPAPPRAWTTHQLHCTYIVVVGERTPAEIRHRTVNVYSLPREVQARVVETRYCAYKFPSDPSAFALPYQAQPTSIVEIS